MADDNEEDVLGWTVVILVILGGLAWYFIKQEQQQAAAPAPTPGNNFTGLYNAMILTADQQAAADLITTKAEAAGLNPAFMIALAVTESSLNPAAVGDDGVSVGLFQINTNFNPTYSMADLQVADTNADLSMTMMQSLLAQYPGHTYADYAEAWTLGGHGRFELGRRNPQKVVALSRAVSDLKLALDVTVVA